MTEVDDRRSSTYATKADGEGVVRGKGSERRLEKLGRGFLGVYWSRWMGKPGSEHDKRWNPGGDRGCSQSEGIM